MNGELQNPKIQHVQGTAESDNNTGDAANMTSVTR